MKSLISCNSTELKCKNNFNAIVHSFGKYSLGTFAHLDIAFEFASCSSQKFKLKY